MMKCCPARWHIRGESLKDKPIYFWGFSNFLPICTFAILLRLNVCVIPSYLLERDFPGMRIGPEPTTDNFHVIEFAEQEGKVPGE